MSKQIDFATINVIPSRNIQIIERIRMCVDQKTGMPSRVRITAVIDRHKAKSQVLTMPIFLPVSNYRSEEHMKMLNQFRSGEPFVAVICEDLKVYRCKDKKTNAWYYYAYANRFVVIDYYLTDGGADE